MRFTIDYNHSFGIVCLMFTAQLKLLVAIFFASALSAEPLVHNHHDHDEAVKIECLACENGF